LAADDERHRLFSYLEDRFGIPENLFDDYLLLKRKKSWRLLKNVPQVIFASRFKASEIGLKAFEKVSRFVKPTTRMIQIFGCAATKARLEIEENQLIELLEGGELQVDMNLETGYVILELGGNRVLGLGFIVDGRVRSQLPRKEIREIMIRGPS